MIGADFNLETWSIRPSVMVVTSKNRSPEDREIALILLPVLCVDYRSDWQRLRALLAKLGEIRVGPDLKVISPCDRELKGSGLSAR